MQFRHVQGMEDVLPTDSGRWRRLEAEFHRTMQLTGYGELRTPVLEHTELFKRSIGEVTDIVEKEMYSFQHSREHLTLRPEGTAGAVRAYVQHKVASAEPVSRWYYLGPMFRAERPQRGRLRQFHQLGAESFGDAGPLVDAELIDTLYGMLSRLGVTELDVRINSLGSAETRARYRAALVDHFTPHAAELSATSHERLQKNPLRILDSKAPQDRPLIDAAPSILELLSEEDRAHFEGLQAALTELGTPYTVDPGLVRGLDYYTRTLFEIRSSAGDLGAQNTLLGGGRYDGMVRSLGGPECPAIGFAAGVERLLLALPPSPSPVTPLVFFAPLGAAAQRACLTLARQVRALGHVALVDGRGGSLKSLLRRADGLRAPLCVVVGESELARGEVQLKQLELHQQSSLPLDTAAQQLAALLDVLAAGSAG